MICLSRNDIEQIAVRVLRKYRSLPEMRGLSITKIDPTLLAESVMHLKLDYVHLSLTGKILGLTCYDEVGVTVYDETDTPFFYILDGNTILVEADLRADCSCVGRRNFSIAHETAHQIFGKLHPKEYGAPEKNKIHFYEPGSNIGPVKNWIEWQANVLASALLLPEDILRANMHMFGLGGKIEILNSRYRQEVFTRFYLLAEYMGVSKQALAIRLKHLHLLDEEYLNRANDLLNIYKE